jgi:hypothetical protein
MVQVDVNIICCIIIRILYCTINIIYYHIAIYIDIDHFEDGYAKHSYIGTHLIHSKKLQIKNKHKNIKTEKRKKVAPHFRSQHFSQ